MGFPGGSAGKESACNVGDLGSIPGLGRSHGEGKGYPLQYSWASLVAQIGKESACNVGDLGSIPGLGRSPRGGHANPLQYSCLEIPHGQRSLAGYGPRGGKESDTIERLSTAPLASQPSRTEGWSSGPCARPPALGELPVALPVTLLH